MAQQREKVLVCNGGSSSLKVVCYDVIQHKQEHAATFSANPERLIKELNNYLIKFFPEKNSLSILHRIVHAGEVSEGATLIDDAVLAKIEHWQVVAPLHNALALQIIASTSEHFPDAKHYAFFDSGLFGELPRLAKYYALPEGLSKNWPLLRYGFHGLAHRFQWKRLQEMGSEKNAYRKVITLQLGSGCSATAWLDGRVMDTSMGFSPLEGLTMATRSGSIDPGILLHLMAQESYSLAELTDLLNKSSGIQGLSGSKNEMKDILREQNEASRFAVDFFCYQISKILGAYTLVLGGLDAISLGGGIAEYHPHVRAKILEKLEFMGFELDDNLNQAIQAETFLHKQNSQIHACLIPVDEMQEMLSQFLRMTTNE